MNAYVIQILAMGLTISQLFTKPVGEFRTHFNEKADQEVVKALIHDGCGLVTKAFGAEGMDTTKVWDMIVPKTGAASAPVVDENDSTGADAPAPANSPAASRMAAFTAKMDPATMYAAYQEICLDQKRENSPVHLDEVIAFYNETLKDLPDHTVLKNFRYKQASVLRDGQGKLFTEIYKDQNRRAFVPLNRIPDRVAQAFISAEDRNFRSHANGLDLNGIVRAFIVGFTSGDDKKRPPGGSTIDQQVIKNTLLDSSVKITRKMKEMVLAARMANLLTRDEVLELYLNYVFLGRASWGVEYAAREYFGKSITEVSLSEAAFIAGMNKGPNFYNPDLREDEVEKRRLYVLGRMKIDRPEMTAEIEQAEKTPPVFKKGFVPPRKRGGLYMVDEIRRQAKQFAGITDLDSGGYNVRSTLDAKLQYEIEGTLQNGLADYEARNGRAQFDGKVNELATEIKTYKKDWKDVIGHISSKLYDVQWPVATVLQPAKNGQIIVGLQDGSTAQLDYGKVSKISAQNLSKLEQYDLIHVDSAVATKSGKVRLKIPPHVQGAMVVLEAKTGRVLALSGGFSYPASQYNRATTGVRQPGSTFKPFAYAYAIDQGMQPNTLIPNMPQPITIPGRPAWQPSNYNGSGSAPITMAWAIENSLNVAAANMIARVNQTPVEGLNGVCKVTVDLGVYGDCDKLTFPFVLGAREASVIDMAAGYAAILNLGLKPTPYVIDTISKDGAELWRRPFARLQPVVKTTANDPHTIRDQASFYQTRRLMEGVISRGTAVSFKSLTGYVAGKTGTSNNWNDAWFIGFTADVVVATWIGYDNPKGQPPRTLGKDQTGASVALPIGGKILGNLVRANPTPLPGPPAGVAARLVDAQMNRTNGSLGQGDAVESFRRDQNGQPFDSRYRIVTESDMQYGVGAQQAVDGDGDPVSSVGYQSSDQNDPDAREHYQPGQDDQYQVWRDQNRQVDPVFRGYGF